MGYKVDDDGVSESLGEALSRLTTRRNVLTGVTVAAGGVVLLAGMDLSSNSNPV